MRSGTTRPAASRLVRSNQRSRRLCLPPVLVLHYAFFFLLALRSVTFARDLVAVEELEPDASSFAVPISNQPPLRILHSSKTRNNLNRGGGLREQEHRNLQAASSSLEKDNLTTQRESFGRGPPKNSLQQNQQNQRKLRQQPKQQPQKQPLLKQQQQQQRPLKKNQAKNQAKRNVNRKTSVLDSSNSNSDNAQQQDNEQDQDRPGFDFIVAGFPKCGTTTLLKAFEAHPETDMSSREQCAIASPLQADKKVHNLLDQTLDQLSSDPQMKRSFKCPTAMYNTKSLARMQHHSPHTKFIIGMRHPVHMLQSFYNYRVTELREKGLAEPIPSLQEIIDRGEPWKGVSLQSTQFELFLLQLGKTNVSVPQIQDLLGQPYDLAIQPNDFPIFLYTVDQMEDADPHRSQVFRSTLQRFLELKHPLAPLGHENQNHAATEHQQDSSFINICDEQWKAVREQLVQQGAATAHWIRTQFIHSHPVHVANQQHFLETLESWGTDPCSVSDDGQQQQEPAALA